MKLLNAATKPVVVVLLLVVMCVMSASSTRRHHRRHYRHHGGQNTAQSGSSRASPTAAVRGGDQPTPWPSNCSHCSIRQAKKNYRLATIKNEILRKLHLRSPPNITRRRLPDIPPLRDLIGDDMVSDSPDEFSDHEYHATTVKMMLFPTRDPPVNHSGACQFRISSDLNKNDVYKATLGVYVRRTAGTAWNTYLLVYAVLEPRNGVRRMIGRRPIHLRAGSTSAWHQFKITREVRGWLDNSTTNHGLIIEATDDRGVPVAVVQTNRSDDEPFKPYLEIQVQQHSSSRSKRNLDLDCDEHSAEERCCRYPLVVDFESFGWDFVIVPRRYSAYYCAGDCPFLYYQQNAHAHVVQQQQQQQQQQSSRSGTATAVAAAGGGPCCSPRRVSAISMLYYDDYMNIVYGHLPGMVVDQCGCS